MFRLTQHGEPAADWLPPIWEAEDETGNRGQTLGLHEPLLKFIAIVYSNPDSVNDTNHCWELPPFKLPLPATGIQWNTNRHLGDASVIVRNIGLNGLNICSADITQTGTSARNRLFVGLKPRTGKTSWTELRSLDQ